MSRKLAVSFVVAAVLLAIAVYSGRKATEQQALETGSEEPAGDGRAGLGNSEPDIAESRMASGDWNDAFTFVRDAIRTEPSRFALKTVEGVSRGRSGNSLEKALLLAKLLQGKGRRVEVARGVLDDAHARELLGAIFPRAGSGAVANGVPLSNPSEEPALVFAVKRHFWVRMEDGDSWTDLDPSFPSSEPGHSFASADETLDPADDSLSTNVSISLESTEDGANKPRSVLAWNGPMSEVANGPLSVALVAHFAKDEAADKEGASGPAGQALARNRVDVDARASYNAVLSVGGESLAEGEIPAGVRRVARISLKTTFECLGEVVSQSERVLYEATGKPSDPHLFQRHTLLLTGDRISAAAWQDTLKTVSDKSSLADVKTRVEEIRESLQEKRATARTLAAGASLEREVGPALGHLVNMIFASTSDDQTAQAGAALSVASWYAVPRVLITSFSGGGDSTETTIDLRQDRVEAVSLPGQARGMSQTFQYGRGVMESVLEGKLLELLAGKPALTTAVVMQLAARDGIPSRIFSAQEQERLKALGPPSEVLGKLLAALDAGRVVVVPDQAVDWEGRQRWGWWTIHPQTRETIGVLDSGLHQGMVQRTILETEGPMQSRMGAVLGAMVGTIDTYWLLSATVLKYGELNNRALLEAKAYMKQIQSVMCPGFEKKAGASVGVTLVDIEGCYKKEIELVSIEGGVEISQGWCEQFAKGFTCASTSILNYYLSQFE